LVASNFDPACPEGSASLVYGQPLGLDAETIHGAGHLSISDGYGPWPAVLGWCLDESFRFGDDDAGLVGRDKCKRVGAVPAYGRPHRSR
jgi:uncharacterized protein